MAQALINTAFQAFLILSIIAVALILISLRWQRARPVRHFYGSVITTTLIVIAQFLWRPRLERHGGAQLSLPQLDMEEEEWH